MDANSRPVIKENHENLIRVESKSEDGKGWYLFTSNDRNLDEYDAIEIIGLKDLDVLELPIGMTSLFQITIRNCRVIEIRITLDTAVESSLFSLWYDQGKGPYLLIENLIMKI